MVAGEWGCGAVLESVAILIGGQKREGEVRERERARPLHDLASGLPSPPTEWGKHAALARSAGSEVCEWCWYIMCFSLDSFQKEREGREV
jgi:hypothetical protein